MRNYIVANRAIPKGVIIGYFLTEEGKSDIHIHGDVADIEVSQSDLVKNEHRGSFCDIYKEDGHKHNYNPDLSDVNNSVFTCVCGNEITEQEDSGTGA